MEPKVPKMPTWGYPGNLLLTVLVLTLIAYFVTITYWTLWPYTPIVVDCPMKIMNPGKKVKAGDHVIYQIKYDKKLNISGQLTRKLVNSYKLDLADSDATAPVGPDTDQVKILVPSFADPGVYYVWWSCKYKVNPIRHVTVTAHSETFEVTK